MYYLLTKHKSICKALETKTAKEVALIFGVNQRALEKFIERNSISINELRKNYAKKLLVKSHRKHTIEEMVNITGFSRNKVTRIMAEFGIQSKFSNQKIN